MVKYGDFFLKLDITEKYGITNVQPMSAYDISRLEGHDPANPQMVQFEFIPQQGSGHVGARHSKEVENQLY